MTRNGVFSVLSAFLLLGVAASPVAAQGGWRKSVSWGALVDMRTFRYDGQAGVSTHVTGTVGGERVDEIELSAGDETRVTMFMAALMARFPAGVHHQRPCVVGPGRHRSAAVGASGTVYRIPLRETSG